MSEVVDTKMKTMRLLTKLRRDGEQPGHTILRALEEADSRGAHDSCGCVFCDTGLEPELRDGRPVHPITIRQDGKVSDGWAQCWRRC